MFDENMEKDRRKFDYEFNKSKFTTPLTFDEYKLFLDMSESLTRICCQSRMGIRYINY